MGRLFGTIQIDGKTCWTLFDSGAKNTCVVADAARLLSRARLPTPRATGIGGKVRHAAEVCCLVGTLEGRPIEVDAYVLDEIGQDDDGHPIEILFGALAMQKWGVALVPEEERLDMSRYPKEFTEFAEA